MDYKGIIGAIICPRKDMTIWGSSIQDIATWTLWEEYELQSLFPLMDVGSSEGIRDGLY